MTTEVVTIVVDATPWWVVFIGVYLQTVCLIAWHLSQKEISEKSLDIHLYV